MGWVATGEERWPHGTAAESVLKAFSARPGAATDLMGRYLEHAREAFNAASQQHSLKTTLVILLTGNRRALWGHIGDSRLYYLTAGKIAFQTKDHSLPQLMANAGEISDEQIRFHEDRNRLTGAFDGGELNRFRIQEKPVTLKRGGRVFTLQRRLLGICLRAGDDR
jgi:serine/threonine protein phosphatase PrpC